MRTRFPLVFLLVLLIVAVACSGGSEGSAPSSSGVLWGHAVVIDEREATTLEVYPDRIRMPGSHPKAGRVLVGSVLVGGSKDKQILRRVTGVAKSGDDLDLATIDARLTDAFRDLVLRVPGEASPVGSGALSPRSEGSTPGGKFTLSLPGLPTISESPPGITSRTTMTQRTAVTPSLEIVIKDGELRTFAFELTGDVMIQLQHHIAASSAKSIKFGIDAWPKPAGLPVAVLYFVVPTPIGPVPGWIDLTPHLYLGLELGVSQAGSVDFATRLDGSVTTGVRYVPPARPQVYVAPRLTLSADAPALDVREAITVSASITPALEAKLYSLVGPELGFKVKGKVQAVPSGRPFLLDADVGVSVGAVLGGKLGTLGVEVGFSEDVELASTKLWTGQVCIAPDPGVCEASRDAGVDAADAGPIADAGGPKDAGVADSGVVDSGVVDSGVKDSGVKDSGVVLTCPGAPPCSGHGTCNATTGVCACATGYTGADCSASACTTAPAIVEVLAQDVLGPWATTTAGVGKTYEIVGGLQNPCATTVSVRRLIWTWKVGGTIVNQTIESDQALSPGTWYLHHGVKYTPVTADLGKTLTAQLQVCHPLTTDCGVPVGKVMTVVP